MRYLDVCAGISAATVAWKPSGWYRRIQDHRFGRLVAVRPVGKSGNHLLWECRCDCGNLASISTNRLRTDDRGTKSCGCLRREAQVRRIKADGVWNEGKSYAINDGQRCYKTRHSWAKAVIRAKGNKCEKCGWAEARCDVHHKIPKSQGGLHTIENGEVICPNCHRKEHDRIHREVE